MSTISPPSPPTATSLADLDHVVEADQGGVRELAFELGLTGDEFENIVGALTRVPNPVEVAVFAGMWSEHCAYKSTRHLLATLPVDGPGVLAGPGSHAGCVDVGEGWAVAFKVESHNHPSAVEPYQGAATGIGGILRDIVAQGARPVAVMDALCFGDPKSPRTHRLRTGIVAGIAGYGNAYGVANVGGSLIYDTRYEENPLVNALAAGLLRHGELRSGAASGPGNVVVYAGATTGRDGILGAAFASEELADADDQHESRSHVQVGDPFMGKKLMEACLAFGPEQGLVACQDLGASGIACAVSEMAAAGGVGFDLDLGAVPLRQPDMEPAEVLLSESQERFLFVVEEARAAEAVAHFRSFGVHAAAVGAVTDSGRIRVRWRGEVVVDLPAALVADEAPGQLWPAAASLPPPVPYSPFPQPSDLGNVLLALLETPDISDPHPVYTHFDQTVGNRTVRGPGQGEAAVLKLPGSHRGFALCLEGRGDVCRDNPYRGVQVLLGEVVRNLACSGADIVALTDGLNVGAPSDPVEYLRLSELIRGLGDGARRLGIPITGGNCSLYNESPEGTIPPTPILGGLGLVEDVRNVPHPGWEPGEVVFLFGELPDHPVFSVYGKTQTGSTEGHTPHVDLDADRRLADFVLSQIALRRVTTAKDGSKGGLAVALAKLCIRSDVGATVSLPQQIGREDWALFGEYAATAWLTVHPNDAAAVERAAVLAGVPVHRAGLTGGDRLRIEAVIDLTIEELEAAFAGEGVPV